MYTLGQKAIAIGTIVFMNLLVFLFLRWFVVVSLFASAPLAYAIWRR